MKTKVGQIISKANKVFLIAHVDPDGDTIGSTLALAHALRSMGKDCSLACSDPVPVTLSFLPGVEWFGAPRVTDHDLIIAVDVSDRGRLGAAYSDVVETGIPLLNIDHHVTNTGFGTVNLVDTDAVATSEIIFDLLQDMEVPLDEPLATCLLTGIVTDTRSFTTSSTTPRALEVSSELVKAGASLIEVNENYYKSKSLGTLRLWGKILDQMQLEGRLVWSVDSLEMREQCRAGFSNGDGIVNLLASVREASAAIVFIEKESQRVEISIRSRPGVDISPIAVHFGGGGHPQAAGAMLEESLEQVIPKVLRKAQAVLDSEGQAWPPRQPG
jgi:phosphoesterase RecJ-like protein